MLAAAESGHHHLVYRILIGGLDDGMNRQALARLRPSFHKERRASVDTASSPLFLVSPLHSL